MDDYDEAEQWERAGKQGDKIRALIAKDQKRNPILKILDHITPELHPDDDSETKSWDYRSGSDDLEKHNYLKKEAANMSAKERQDLMKRYSKRVFDPKEGLDAGTSRMQFLRQQAPLSNLKKVEQAINSRIKPGPLQTGTNIHDDWDKWSKTGVAPWENEAFKERMEAKQLRKLMEAGGQFDKPGLGRQAAGYLKTAVPKAFEYIGAPLAAVTTAGEAASNKLIGPAATRMGSKALGFMGNPWLATLAGMFTPTGMDQDRSAEYIGSPHHQQWLARRGPLAKR